MMVILTSYYSSSSLPNTRRNAEVNTIDDVNHPLFPNASHSTNSQQDQKCSREQCPKPLVYQSAMVRGWICNRVSAGHDATNGPLHFEPFANLMSTFGSLNITFRPLDMVEF